MSIDELKHRIKTLDLGVDTRLLEITQHRRSITRMEALNRDDLREMRRLQQSLDKLEDDAISASISESISESRRPGSTAFAAAVGTAMRDVGFDGEGPDATAKVLYTSATLAYQGKRFVNPHQGGQRHDLLAETMRAFFCGYYAPSGTLYTEVL